MNRFSILIIIFLFTSKFIISESYSQVNEIDSLEKQINAYELIDTNRVILLFEASSKLLNIDREKSFKYSKEALKISDSLKYQLGQANALYLIGDYYYRDDNYLKSIEYFNKSLDISLKLKDQYTVAYCYNNIGNSYFRLGKYSKSAVSYKKSLGIFEELDNEGFASHCLGNIGTVYKLKGDYSEALYYYEKSLKIRKKLNDSIGVAMTLNNIGLIHNEIGDYSKASEYLNKSIKINRILGKQVEVSRTSSNLASVYLLQNQLDSSLLFFNQSIDIANKYDSKHILGLAYNGKGSVFEKKQNLPKAIEFYFLSLKKREEINDKKGMSEAYNSIGNLYLKCNQLVKAQTYLNKGYIIAKEIGSPNLLKTASEGLTFLHEKKGNYKKSLEYYKIFKKMNDSLINEKNIKSLAKFEIAKQFEEEKREIELEQQKNKAVQAEKNKKQATIIYSLITSFILMLTIIILISLSNAQKKKLNKQLAAQKDELKEHKNNLEKIVDERTKDLKHAKEIAEESVAFKNSILKNISHEIRTPLNGIVGYSSILVNDKVNEKEKIELSSHINNNSQELIHTIENIIEVSDLESRKYKLQSEEIIVNNVIEELINSLGTNLFNNVQVNAFYPDKVIVIRNDKKKFTNVIKNILYNAIKYTEKGHINIYYDIDTIENIKLPDNIDDSIFSNHVLYIKIEDSGIGINSEFDNKIYETFIKDESDKNKLFRGVGLGLSISKLIIELMGGIIWHTANNSGGTTFNIVLNTD